MADTSPAFAKVTVNNHSAGLTVTNIVLILCSGIIVIANTLIRFRTATIASLDSLAIYLGMALAIGETVTVQIAVNNGLGTHQHSLSPSNFASYSKANYAAQILYVLVLACSKLSVTQLILSIQPQRSVFLATHATTAVIVVWIFTSVFALAFQCNLSSTWLIATNRCINLEALYDYIGVINILTDIVLVILPLPMMWKIQMSAYKKVLVLALFAVRLVVPTITIIQLVYLSHYFHTLGDQTWSNTSPWILTQVVMNTSIISACIPSLRRVVTELRTHQTGVTISEGMEFGTVRSGRSKSSATGKSTFSGSGSRSKKSNTAAEKGEEQGDIMPYGHNPPYDKARRALTHISVGKSPARQNKEEERPSQERLRGGSGNSGGITRTVDYRVEEDDCMTKSSDSEQVEFHAL